MKVKPFTIRGVDKYGLIKSGGSVHAKPNIQFSDSKGGCPLDNCQCSKDHHYMAITFGRNDKGVVKGVTVYFKSRQEMIKELNLKK